MSCEAKNTPGNGIKRKGKPSIEFYVDGKPQYYCYGYIDSMTDEIIDECKRCPKYVDKAQEDLKIIKNKKYEVKNE